MKKIYLTRELGLLWNQSSRTKMAKNVQKTLSVICLLTATLLSMESCKKEIAPDNITSSNTSNTRDTLGESFLCLPILPGRERDLDNSIDQKKSLGFMNTGYSWGNSFPITLRVGFGYMDADLIKKTDRKLDILRKYRDYTMSVLKEWEQVANVKFVAVYAHEQPDVGIYFENSQNSRAAIGVSNRNETKKNGYSVQLGFADYFNNNQPTSLLKAQILHEFGHVLGLEHEHQRPGGSLNWNMTKVYQYYKKLGFDNDQIKRQITDKLDFRASIYSEFDNNSIMMYDFGADLTTNAQGSKKKTGLSDMDKQFIEQMYPFTTTKRYCLFIGQKLEPAGRVRNISNHNPTELTSKNGKFILKILNGTLVLKYANDNSYTIWSYRPGRDGDVSSISVDKNGSLVDDRNNTIFVNSVNGSILAGAHLEVSDNGYVKILNGSQELWKSPSSLKQEDIRRILSTAANIIELKKGEQVTSDNGKYKLILQNDGNLVLYNASNRPIWHTWTSSSYKASQVDHFNVQDDGNMVIYSADGKPIWASNTWIGSGKYNVSLRLQDDGNLVLYNNTKGKPIWTSNTYMQ